MRFPRFLVLAAAALLSAPLRADVNEFNNNPCTYKVVVVKQYIFTNSVLGSCPTFEATIEYGGYLSITNYYESGPGYTFEIRYETQYSYYTPNNVATFSSSLIHVPFATSAPVTTATVTIPTGVDMSQVSFSSTNTQRFQLVPGTTDTNARTITFSLIAMSATPANAPGGDANVRVHYGPNESCLGPAVVCVQPKTQVQYNYSSGSPTWTNSHEILPNGQQRLWTELYRDVTINVRDQYANSLHPSFNGTNKVNEIFSNATPTTAHPYIPAGENVISLPTGSLANSTLEDRCGFNTPMTLPANSLSAQGLSDWDNKQYTGLALAGTPIHNVQQAYGNFTTSVTMELKVWGTVLTNSYTRTFSHVAGNVPTFNVNHQ